MSKLILPLSLMITLTLAAADAQVSTDNVVICESGKVKTLKIKNLTGVRVGSITFAHIQEQRGDEVSIYATAPGETTLELTTRGGRKETLRLRVLSKEAPTTQELNQITGAGTASSKEAVPAAAMSIQEPPTAAAIVPTPRTPRDERPRPRRSASRLQISLEPYFLMDTERYPVTHVEHSEEDGHSHSTDNAEFATVRRSVGVMPVSLRFDISSRNSLSMVVPFINRVDEIIVGKDKRKTVTRGLGDIQFGIERVFPRLRGSAWDGVFGLSASVPTGRSIYDATEGKSPLGLGHYEVGSQMSVRRVFDPIALNASLGVYYTLPRTVNGERITPGLGHSIQTGVTYALTDRWAFSEQLNYSRRPNVFLNSPNDLQIYKSEQAYITHGVLYNPRDGSHVFRFSFSLGLTPTSTDRGFGVSYIYQRKHTVAR